MSDANWRKGAKRLCILRRLYATMEQRGERMKLQRIRCAPLARAWDLTVSPEYIVGCTGRKAVILDRQYKLLQTVEGLDHVYTARLSPDETQLLLISAGNRFYVTDMASGVTRKALVRAPFNGNLEGEGCWSHDGRFIYIPVLRAEGLNSTLRRYRAEDLSIDEEFLKDEYWLTNLHPLRMSDAYFMVGLHRPLQRRYFLVLKDGGVKRIPLDGEDGVFFRSFIQEEKQEICLSSTKGCMRYALNGERKETIVNPFASEKAEARDFIAKYARSQCGRYIFMATNAGFYLLDAATKQLLCHIPEEYGVQNFEQLEPDVIALAGWNGVKLYRMTDE